MPGVETIRIDAEPGPIEVMLNRTALVNAVVAAFLYGCSVVSRATITRPVTTPERVRAT